jgi:glycosyltransferase involved in cell wall biosynthesis
LHETFPCAAAALAYAGGRFASGRLGKPGARVGIDGSLLGRVVNGKPIVTGLERYIEELTVHLSHGQSDMDPVLYVGASGQFSNELRSANIHLAQSVPAAICRDLGSHAINLLHIPFADPSLPVFFPLHYARRSVITVLDMIPFLWPGYLSPKRADHFLRRLVWASKRASALLFLSQSGVDDFERIAGPVDTPKYITPMGVDQRFSILASEYALDAVRTKYKLPEKMIIAVGRPFAHKNYPALIAAVASLRSREIDVPHVVIIGPTDNFDGMKGLNEAIKEHNAASWTAVLGNVDSDDLPALYQCASLFVTPSLYEGFGIPVLEAMASGVPVVSSNAASLPEVVGDAGFVVDAKRPDQLAWAIDRVLTDRDLRQELVKKGHRRVALFTWQETARRTADVYRAVLDGD